MSKDRISREYDEGVESFIQFITLNVRYLNYIICLCLQYDNLMNHTP